MSFLNKYNNTSAQLFKIRMQLKAQINDLRKTYEQVVFQKPLTKKKHFQEKLRVKTTLLPDQINSNKKTPEKRHYTPTRGKQIKEQNSLSCKRQYQNKKNTDNLKQVLKHKEKTHNRSLTPLLRAKHNDSVSQIISHNQSFDGINIGQKDKSLTKQKRPSKKIIPKYHVYKYDLLLG